MSCRYYLIKTGSSFAISVLVELDVYASGTHTSTYPHSHQNHLLCQCEVHCIVRAHITPYPRETNIKQIYNIVYTCSAPIMVLTLTTSDNEIGFEYSCRPTGLQTVLVSHGLTV